MEELRIYYMRDNHTYRALSLDVGKAIEQMRSEWGDGYTHGMLCSKAPGMPPLVHAHGSKRWGEFEAAARAYYAAALSNSN